MKHVLTKLINRYHWALLVGPKFEHEGSKGTRLHTKNSNPPTVPKTWVFEEAENTLGPNNAQLVRVVIGKVKNKARLFDRIRSVKVVQGDLKWTCISWVREAIGVVLRDSEVLGTSFKNWEEVRIAALKYVDEKKVQHRFDGKASPGRFDIMKAATYDALEKRELIE